MLIEVSADPGSEREGKPRREDQHVEVCVAQQVV